ncbi:hypothetical protein Bbelb_140300 [Branchiostoma belcheri]|nr:hypothetical protein Bbelb_140300 [Branchiostoma belcheri]
MATDTTLVQKKAEEGFGRVEFCSGHVVKPEEARPSKPPVQVRQVFLGGWSDGSRCVATNCVLCCVLPGLNAVVLGFHRVPLNCIVYPRINTVGLRSPETRRAVVTRNRVYVKHGGKKAMEPSSHNPNFKPLSPESLTCIEQRRVEKEQQGKCSKTALNAMVVATTSTTANEAVQEEELLAVKDPDLQDGRVLPPSLGPFPEKLTGQPLEDFDPYYQREMVSGHHVFAQRLY